LPRGAVHARPVSHPKTKEIIMKLVKTLACLCAFLFVQQSALAFEPRNVLCIAPSDPGGGWDFTCRNMAPILSDLKLVKGRIRTQNMPGAGGGVAYAHVVGQQKKNANVMVAASTATTTRLAQGMFKGFDEESVRWVAALGADYGVVAVAPNSRFKTLGDLAAALKANPAGVSFVGGSAVGGWDHLKMLMLADAAGVDNLSAVRYTSFSSGGPAIIEILGGRADVFTGDVSETLSQLESGNLKVLAVLGDERLEGSLSHIPTAKEQGYNVIGANWRGFYLAPGISDAEYAYWSDAMLKLAQSEKFKVLREQNGLAPFLRTGAEMDSFVRNQVATIEKLFARMAQK
jgi:putative tricarboxylic transport membrane protein